MKIEGSKPVVRGLSCDHCKRTAQHSGYAPLAEDFRFHPAPEGYEYVGEFRVPELGEIVLRYDGYPGRVESHLRSRMHILREVEPVTDPREKGYAKDNPAPEGYEYTGEFRLPRDGEWFLSSWNRAEEAFFNFRTDSRHILRKVKVTDRRAEGYAKDNVAPEGYEYTGEFRAPRAGDYFLSLWGEALRGYGTHPADKKRHILRMIEQPKAPEGFELTGEFRLPRIGEYYLYSGAYLRCSHRHQASSPKRWILQKQEEPKTPLFRDLGYPNGAEIKGVLFTEDELSELADELS